MSAALRHQFEEQLKGLQQDVLRMGMYVVQMLDLAMEALVAQDLALVERVIAMDDTADQMDREIEQTCLRLLALQQPMSKDLRIISTALKIIADLERIGDFSVDIAKTVRRLAHEPAVPLPSRMSEMSLCVKTLVEEALQAYVGHDLERVRRSIEMDDRVDDLYDKLFSELLQQGDRDPSLFHQAVWLTYLIHFLERIADHAVNVAERVSYMETGQFADLALSHSSNSG